MKDYSSHFKTDINSFVEEKHASGFPYHSSICVLKRFDVLSTIHRKEH